MSELDELQIDQEYTCGLQEAFIRALYTYGNDGDSTLIRTAEVYHVCAMTAAHLFAITKSQGAHNISTKEFSDWMAKRIHAYVKITADHPELMEIYQSQRFEGPLN